MVLNSFAPDPHCGLFAPKLPLRRPCQLLRRRDLRQIKPDLSQISLNPLFLRLDAEQMRRDPQRVESHLKPIKLDLLQMKLCPFCLRLNLAQIRRCVSQMQLNALQFKPDPAPPQAA